MGLMQASIDDKELFGGTWSDPACLSSTCNHTWTVVLRLLVHKSVIGVMVSEAAFLGALGLFGPAAEVPEKQVVVCLAAKTAGEHSASCDEC